RGRGVGHPRPGRLRAGRRGARARNLGRNPRLREHLGRAVRLGHEEERRAGRRERANPGRRAARGNRGGAGLTHNDPDRIGKEQSTMPGLLRGVARTAVVAGTATAVSNRVSRRQAERWYGDEQQQGYEEQAPAAAPPPAAAAPEVDPLEQLKKLGELRDAG